jgi:hypothetical protein
VNYDYEDWYYEGGLITDVTALILSIAFIEPFTWVIDPQYLYKLVMRPIEKK